MKAFLTTLLLLAALVAGLASPTALAAEPQAPPKIVFLVSEDPNNYEATRTIPVFAKMLSDKYGCKCQVITGQGGPKAFSFPGLETIKDADLVVVFFRRVAITPEQYALIRGHLKAGKPLVGIRTANHAFSVHGDPAKGYEKWWEFVPEVLGCKNRGYGSSEFGGDVAHVAAAAGHAILKGVTPDKWHSKGCIYLVAPIVDKKATVLMTATTEGKVEPVTWTRDYNGSRVFYTSLGFGTDFYLPQFRKMLTNGIYWAMNRPMPK